MLVSLDVWQREREVIFCKKDRWDQLRKEGGGLAINTMFLARALKEGVKLLA
jgi:hypothetical protein